MKNNNIVEDLIRQVNIIKNQISVMEKAGYDTNTLKSLMDSFIKEIESASLKDNTNNCNSTGVGSPAVNVLKETSIDKGPLSDYTFVEYPKGIFITKYIGFDAEYLMLPQYYNGKPIIGIGFSAFANLDFLKKIGLPSTIQCIGRRAFANCTNLSSIALPKGLILIGDNAFRNCQLTSITIPNNCLYIGERAFEGTSIEKIVLPDSLRVLSPYTFAECKMLKKVVFSKNMRFIEEGAFSDCNKLNDVDLNNGLEKIGPKAFLNCDSLHDIDIPSSVTKIEYNAFYLYKLWQPDRRYKERYKYYGPDLTIYCQSGSVAQHHARVEEYPCKKSTKYYPPVSDTTKFCVYLAQGHKKEEDFSYFSDKLYETEYIFQDLDMRFWIIADNNYVKRLDPNSSNPSPGSYSVPENYQNVKITRLV